MTCMTNTKLLVSLGNKKAQQQCLHLVCGITGLFFLFAPFCIFQLPKLTVWTMF